jgi:kumamolisin
MSKSPRFASQPRVALPGSDRKPFAGTAARAAVSPSDERITVTVVLNRKQPIPAAALTDPAARLTREQFAERHGADAASVELLRAFARESGLTVKSGAGPCDLKVSGTKAAMEKAFGVKLKAHKAGGKTFRVRQGPIFLPQELSGHVVAVLGLDNRPQAKAHFRVVKPRATNVSYTPVQVAGFYGYPAGASAAGETIGLIELGGGFKTADITAYFKSLGVTAPKVKAVLVDGGKNSPTTASSADGEVMLDIEVSGAVAPAVNIAVYFAPNTDQGFIDAVTQAVHDTTNKPSVISISWGGPESTWTAQALTALDSACQAAAAVGVTITVAVGDNGSSDGVTDGANHVDFPASSPHVLACGGTKLTASGTKITSETVWNETAADEGATGGGVSDVFALPSWQAGAKVPAPTVAAGGRGVPDVAGDADPSTGYSVRVDGQTQVIGGTSAVAPLWAGLIALANAQNKVAAGFVNPALYADPKAFRDITQGNNGAFSAAPGWDACTGLGSPVGTTVIAAVAPGTATKKKSKKVK